MCRRVAVLASLMIATTACTPISSRGSQDSAISQPVLQCQQVSSSHCSLLSRFDAANAYLMSRPGRVGFVLRDRTAQTAYRSELAAERVGTASTIKLAIAADLLMRARTGTTILSPDDWRLIDAMLHSSDDYAADVLWWRYSGSDGLEFTRRFAEFGMTGLTAQPGTETWPYWGWHTCTPNDLDQLMQFVLTRLAEPDRDYLVSRMQDVAENQQWGVWAAGPEQRPGTKVGWSEEQSGWAINSVGFSGTGQRYTLAIMNSLDGAGGFDDGIETISAVAKILLNGLDESA